MIPQSVLNKIQHLDTLDNFDEYRRLETELENFFKLPDLSESEEKVKYLTNRFCKIMPCPEKDQAIFIFQKY